MKRVVRLIFQSMVVCSISTGCSCLAQETVLKLNLQLGTSCNPDNPGICAPSMDGARLANAGLVSRWPYFNECQINSRQFNLDVCTVKLAATPPNSSFQVYRTDQIDQKNLAINNQLDDLSKKVQSLNERMANDEGQLPAEIDQRATQKLMEKIQTLEVRILALEAGTTSH